MTEEIKVQYTDAQQAILDGLTNVQDYLNLSDKKFAKDYLRTVGETTWSKLRSGKYKVEEASLVKQFGELESALTSARRRIARKEAAAQGGPYHEFDTFAAMFRAVEDCLVKKGQNRLIIYVAPPGAGKSRFFAELGVRQELTFVSGSEPWRSSLYFTVIDILEALAVTGKFNSAGEARRAMLEAMKGRAQVIGIDEANYLGPSSINTIKDILNLTEWTVLLAMVPAAFEKLKRYYEAWSQLQRRLHALFVHAPITSKGAQEFLKDAGLNGDAKAAAIELAKEANAFGSYDLIARVIERLDEREEKKHATMDDVQAALAAVKTDLGIK